MTTSAASQSSSISFARRQIFLIDDTPPLHPQHASDSPKLIQQGVRLVTTLQACWLSPVPLSRRRNDSNCLVPMAAALRTALHTASLVHDDTIDNALMRRGLPILESIMDEGTTVLVGDHLSPS